MLTAVVHSHTHTHTTVKVFLNWPQSTTAHEPHERFGFSISMLALVSFSELRTFWTHQGSFITPYTLSIICHKDSVLVAQTHQDTSAHTGTHKDTTDTLGHFRKLHRELSMSFSKLKHIRTHQTL
jgi:hypothetical protein